jgi:N-acyl-D-aspartate/D-glutamate deacylase
LAGLRDRGIITPGAVADLVVYDLEELALCPMEVAHDVPGGEWRRIQQAEGYRYTLVSGQVTFVDGKQTGATPGRVLSPAADIGAAV